MLILVPGSRFVVVMFLRFELAVLDLWFVCIVADFPSRSDVHSIGDLSVIKFLKKFAALRSTRIPLLEISDSR